MNPESIVVDVQQSRLGRHVPLADCPHKDNYEIYGHFRPAKPTFGWNLS